MEKNAKIGLAVILVVIIAAGSGIGIYFVLNPPTQRGEVILTIWGDGTTGNYTLTMDQLKSSKYTQIQNQMFFTENFEGGTDNYTFTGVSLKSILETENILNEAVNYTPGASGYIPGTFRGMLNVSLLMNAGYNEAIIAFNGPDFNVTDDGPVRAVINQSLITHFRAQAYWVTGCKWMIFI